MSDERLEHARDAILVCDPEGKVTYVNDQALHLYGSAAADCIGGEWTQLLCQPIDEAEFGVARRSVAKQGEWKGELFWKCARGGTIKARCSWTVIRGLNDVPMASLIVSREIPDERLAEQRTAARRRREGLGALVIGIAHQLNDIFSTLLLVLDKNGGRAARPRSREGGQRGSVRQYLRKGTDLVSQILEFAGQDDRSTGAVRPDLILSTLQGFLQRLLPGPVQIRVHTEDRLPDIRANGSRVYQLLVDIAIHALDTVPAARSLSISAGRISVDGQFALMAGMSRGSHVGFTVSLRNGEAGNGDIGGADLIDTKSVDGLAELSTEAGRLGGVLKVTGTDRHEPGFVLLLPSENRHNGEAESEEPRKTGGNGEVILVVDDEPAIRESTKMTLQGAGYTVLTAGDGAQAAAMYAREHTRIAAVLIDIMMPHMTGDTAIRTMLQINPRTRIIATSGYASKEKLSHILDMDHVVMLQKPYSGTVLISVVRGVLDHPSHRMSEPARRVVGR